MVPNHTLAEILQDALNYFEDLRDKTESYDDSPDRKHHSMTMTTTVQGTRVRLELTND